MSLHLRPKKTSIRIGGEVARGYLVDSFSDAFKRYLDPILPEEDVTTLQTGTDAAYAPSVTNGVTQALQDENVTDVTDVTPLGREGRLSW